MVDLMTFEYTWRIKNRFKIEKRFSLKTIYFWIKFSMCISKVVAMNWNIPQLLTFTFKANIYSLAVAFKCKTKKLRFVRWSKILFELWELKIQLFCLFLWNIDNFALESFMFDKKLIETIVTKIWNFQFICILHGQMQISYYIRLRLCYAENYKRQQLLRLKMSGLLLKLLSFDVDLIEFPFSEWYRIMLILSWLMMMTILWSSSS